MGLTIGLTDDRYWDCECKEDFIHNKEQMKECLKCGAKEEDQPDSRVSEVALRAKPEPVRPERLDSCPKCEELLDYNMAQDCYNGLSDGMDYTAVCSCGVRVEETYTLTDVHVVEDE